MSREQQTRDRDIVRYAVVGLGHIAQVAILPAFVNARNSQLVAIVSGDAKKRDVLQQRYEVEYAVDYEAYDDLLASGVVDAVYIAMPHHLHYEYTVRAARLGIHVLCEKPMAVTEVECEEMIRECDEAGVRLMIAYRLHFESANLEAIDIAQSGRLGDLRFFWSTFTQQVRPGNFRLNPISKGGGSVADMGIYCINAARYLFRDEPTEVMAFSESGRDSRFKDCDEMTTVAMRFPGDRLASFTSSFGATPVSHYRLVGTEGEIILEPAYGYADELSYRVIVNEAPQIDRTFPKRDQFAPQIIHFSDCVLSDSDPEPDGYEGWADVRIISAIYQSAASGKPVRIEPVPQRRRPDIQQAMKRPGIEKPQEVRASGPSD